MAIVRDTIETVLQILGGAQYVAQMAAAAASAGVFAVAEAALNASLEVTLGLLGVADPLLAGLIVILGALAATIGVVTVSLAAFNQEAAKLFQTGVILKNIASTLTLPQVQQIAQTTSEATGLSRPQIESTAGLLARTGVGGGQIESTLKVIADTARATGKSFDEVGEAIEKGILGHARSLVQFGIVLQDTGSKAANLALIQQQLNLRFEGAAEAFRNTLPGSIDAFQSSMQRFLSGLGEQFAPTAIRVFNALASVLDFLTAHIEQIADAIKMLLLGPLGLLLPRPGGEDNPLARVGHGGDPATEATAQQIADNTARLADAVEGQVLGGSGEVVRQAFGYLHARLALSI